MATLESSMAVPPKIYNYKVTYIPVTLLVGMYPRELRIQVHTATCTWMFVAALLTIAKKWK